MYDTLPTELRMRALCLTPFIIGEPPEAPLERIRWAIDKCGLPAALKQMTDKELGVCQLVYWLKQARKHARETERRLTRRVKAARKARLLMPNDDLPDLDQTIANDEWFLNPEGDPPVEGLKVTRRREIKPFTKVVDQLSAFEVVAGWLIPDIFETHCGIAAGYTRNDADDSIRSEFVDFAEIVLAVLSIEKSDRALYERRSIAEALTKCRRLRNQ